MRRQDESVRRARSQVRRILKQEGGRETSQAVYSLVATQLLAASLKMSTRPHEARRFLHGVLVQLKDDLYALGLDAEDFLRSLARTG